MRSENELPVIIELSEALKAARKWIAHLCEPFNCDDMIVVMKIDAALAKATASMTAAPSSAIAVSR